MVLTVAMIQNVDPSWLLIIEGSRTPPVPTVLVRMGAPPFTCVHDEGSLLLLMDM